MIKWLHCLVGLILLNKEAKSQDSSLFSFSFYSEIYYQYDFSKPLNHTRAPFIYSHNRTGEMNINLGLVKASFNSSRSRANLGIMTGTYSNANLSIEPGVIKNLYEANAGLKISKQHNLWIDAGVLPSHIGFETVIGKDHWTLTRSLAADNSPYYEAGLRFSFDSRNEKWYLALLALNGWQRIQRIDGNNTPAFGYQVSFKPNNNFLLNSSSFVGSDQPDSIRKMRYFNNLYSVWQLSKRIGITIGLDAGLEQKEKSGSAVNLWYTPVLLVKSMMGANKSITIRGEYYNDKSEVLINKINGHSFSSWGYSSNFDWTINKNFLWRFEVRTLQSKRPVFLQQDGSYENSNWSIISALCFHIQN